MITVIASGKGFEPIRGNPVLSSVDGKTKSPLHTILHASWSAKDRAAYGVYLAEPFETPDGMRRVGKAQFVMDDGVLREVYKVEPIPAPVEHAQAPVEEALSKWAKSLGFTLNEIRAALVKGAR
jgi:hypothetical protein